MYKFTKSKTNFNELCTITSKVERISMDFRPICYILFSFVIFYYALGRFYLLVSFWLISYYSFSLLVSFWLGNCRRQFPSGFALKLYRAIGERYGEAVSFHIIYKYLYLSKKLVITVYFLYYIFRKYTVMTKNKNKNI